MSNNSAYLLLFWPLKTPLEVNLWCPDVVGTVPVRNGLKKKVPSGVCLCRMAAAPIYSTALSWIMREEWETEAAVRDQCFDQSRGSVRKSSCFRFSCQWRHLSGLIIEKRVDTLERASRPSHLSAWPSGTSTVPVLVETVCGTIQHYRFPQLSCSITVIIVRRVSLMSALTAT